MDKLKWFDSFQDELHIVRTINLIVINIESFVVSKEVLLVENVVDELKNRHSRGMLDKILYQTQDLDIGSCQAYILYDIDIKHVRNFYKYL